MAGYMVVMIHRETLPAACQSKTSGVWAGAQHQNSATKVYRQWQLVSAFRRRLRQQFTITGMRMVDELRGEVRIPFGDRHDTRKSIMRSLFGHKVRDYHHCCRGVPSRHLLRQATARLLCRKIAWRDTLSSRCLPTDTSTGNKASTPTRWYRSRRQPVIPHVLSRRRWKGWAASSDDQFAYQKQGDNCRHSAS